MGTLLAIGRIANAVTAIYRLLRKVLPVLKTLLARYPALSAAALNATVALATRFGFHMSATELAVILAALSAILGAYVHSHVSPVGKPAGKTVPPK